MTKHIISKYESRIPKGVRDFCIIAPMAGVMDYVYKIEGRLSYGRRFLSLFFFTLSFFLVIYGFTVPYIFENYDSRAYHPIAGFFVATIPFYAGFVLGTQIDVLVNVSKKHIVIHKSVAGVVFKRSIIKYERLEYVSVLRSYTKHHEGRLFYDDHKYLNLFEIRKEWKALSRVNEISNALSIPVHNAIIEEYWKNKKAPYVSPENREISAYFSEGKRPFWQNALALFLFGAALMGVFFLIDLWVRQDFQFEKGLPLLGYIVLMLTALAATLFLVRDYLFDFKNGQYRRIYRMGPLEYGHWMLIRNYEYVSVYKTKDEMYRIRFGYNRDKSFKLGKYGDYETALKMGKRLALKFNVDLIDETAPSGPRSIKNEDIDLLSS
ncbi:hypothetical protein POV27_01315 [Aureisphaera galaxeae]|uniref:hypothetical protein n=1 Tax=Aureisphaera galaxeae TaxID=1538023 RepID=UPI0023500D44|nr:hypothetical protein [Aureisphaera galaxeae]MDC8002677.1 hypothetical protein [Aureisphaera galaxeae]